MKKFIILFSDHILKSNIPRKMPATINDFAESEPPPPPSKCSQCCKIVKKFISFLLSHIGLLSLVVGYCIMGAFIFRELEYRNELEVKRNMTNNRLQVTKDLWEITRYKYINGLIFGPIIYFFDGKSQIFLKYMNSSELTYQIFLAF